MKYALLLFFLGAATSVFAQTPFKKVLFLGNSITKHGPKADIEWTGNWGMAASAEAKDYVHVFMASLAQKQGSTPEILVKNIADFERSYAGYDIANKLKEPIDFGADLIVLAIGENVQALKSDKEAVEFASSVLALLKSVSGNHKPAILVRSSFWAVPAKDSALKLACTEVGGIYVDISALGKDEKNFGRSERPFKHAGVANHPGDRGMEAIAAALVKALDESHAAKGE